MIGDIMGTCTDDYTKGLTRRIKEQRWIDDIIEIGGCCSICGYSENPLIIEKHHLGGRHNGDITIPVCPNCHQELSMRQRGWDRIWAKPDNPPQKRLALMLRGMADVDSLKARLLREASNTLLRDGENETV